MPQVAKAVVKERAARLRTKADEVLHHYLHAEIGRRVDVLGERSGLGRAPGFAEVEVDGLSPGEIRAVRIARVNGNRLVGVAANAD